MLLEVLLAPLSDLTSVELFERTVESDARFDAEFGCERALEGGGDNRGIMLRERGGRTIGISQRTVDAGQNAMQERAASQRVGFERQFAERFKCSTSPISDWKGQLA